MYSCEKGDNSTLSILLAHKTGTFNWGFNKLCERSLAVAATSCQPHSLHLLLHHLATTKGHPPSPSLCWPALHSAILVGHSLTIALILDYMRIFADKHIQSKSKLKDKECNTNFIRPAPINQDIVTALFSKASKSSTVSALPPFLSSSSSSTSTTSSSFYRSLSSIHLLLRAHTCVSGGEKEVIPLLNFLPDDMKSEVKILRLLENLAFDGSLPQAFPDLKENDEYKANNNKNLDKSSEN